MGAGIGGLTAAAAMSQVGWSVDVVERRPGVEPTGVGLGLWGNGLRALGSLGLLEEIVRVGYCRDTFFYHDRNGELVAQERIRLDRDGAPAHCGMRRADLMQILYLAARSGGAEFTFDTAPTDFAELPDQVSVQFSNGNSQNYDVVIASDGIHSRTRAMLFPGVEPEPSGYGGYRIGMPRRPGLTDNSYYQGHAAKVGFALIGSAEMYLVVVAAEPDERREANINPSIVLKLLDDFGGPVPAIRDDVLAATNIAYTPFEHMYLGSQWGSDRIILIGDAAHSFPPHLGQGAGMAIEDAIVLAEMLQGRSADVATALKDFVQRRQGRVQFVYDRSVQRLRDEMDTASEEGYKAQLARLARGWDRAEVDSVLIRDP